MKKRLALVSPLQLGIVLAVLYGLLSLIIVVPMVFFFAAVGSSSHGGGGASFLMILMPILYAVMGFVFGVITGAIYNLVANWTGGIEFTVVDAPQQ